MQFVSCSCCVKIEPKTAVYETKDKILFLLPGLTKKIKPINGIPEKFEQVYEEPLILIIKTQFRPFKVPKFRLDH